MNAVLILTSLLALAATPPPGAPGAASQPVAAEQPHVEGPLKVALVPFAAVEGVTDATAAALTELVAAELRRVPNLQLVTQREVETAISFDRQRTLAGCQEESCLAEIAGALGVGRLVHGTVSRLGESWLVHLKLWDVKRAKALSTSDRRLRRATIDDVMDALPVMVGELFANQPRPQVATAQATGPAPAQTASLPPPQQAQPQPVQPPQKAGPSAPALPGKTEPGVRKNAVYLELLGNGALATLNYERTLFDLGDHADANVRVGVGAGALGMLNLSAGARGHRVEGGLGVAAMVGFPLYLTGTLGYRFTADNGLVFRLGLTPMVSLERYTPLLPADSQTGAAATYATLWGGASVGYAF